MSCRQENLLSCYSMSCRQEKLSCYSMSCQQENLSCYSMSCRQENLLSCYSISCRQQNNQFFYFINNYILFFNEACSTCKKQMAWYICI